MHVITALRERPRARVEIELDGAPWRTVPADAVVRAGLTAGRPLDRETARTLGRELRRARALGDAVRVLRHRDMSRSRLEERLERRGARPDAREEALAALERAGLVDDGRVAAGRARSLADRGWGDAGIRAALEAEGIDGAVVSGAVDGLEPEAERARKLLGPAPDARGLRRLASRGFDAAVLEEHAASFADGP